jgi:hypothetical protein
MRNHYLSNKKILPDQMKMATVFNRKSNDFYGIQLIERYILDGRNNLRKVFLPRIMLRLSSAELSTIYTRQVYLFSFLQFLFFYSFFLETFLSSLSEN